MASEHKTLNRSEQDNSLPQPGSVEQLTRHNIETILELEKAGKEKLTTVDRLAKAIAKFGGSMGFVAVNLIVVTGWILFNTFMPETSHFDPFPFSLLSLVASLEAIFLSTFILISQNQDAALAEQRNQLELQINLLTEQENTKMLAMLKLIANKLDIDVSQDPDVDVLEQATEPEQLAKQIKQLRERDESE